MKHLLRSLFFVLALLVAVVPAGAEAKDAPIISVDGQGSASTAPDQATVTVGVVTSNKDAGQARNENARIATQIRHAVKALGIKDADIQTANYSFYPQYNTQKDGMQTISGYMVNNSVIIKVRNLDLTSKVIDAALASGGNQVSSLDFSASDTKALRKEALTDACKDAREKADILAAALGKRIVGVQNVTESSGYMQPYRSNRILMASMAKAEDMSYETPLEAGSLTMNATVHVDFLIGQ